jgi:hypothetical protein
LSRAVAKLASINLQKLVLSPTGSINLGFILMEDLLLCSSYLPLGVPNWANIYTPSIHFRGRMVVPASLAGSTGWAVVPDKFPELPLACTASLLHSSIYCTPLEVPSAHLVHLCITSLLTCALIPLASPSCAFTDSGQGSSSRRKQAAPKLKGDSGVASEVICPSKMTSRQREAEAKKKTKAPPRKTVDKLSLS